ncbi:MAG: hypothetical protein RIT45_4327, partial [Pseudomonadota bacterium]
SGKVAVVTGANAGIGKVTARELARAGARVILACRSEAKARSAMNEIREAVSGAQLELVRLDLSSFESVRGAAAEIAELAPKLDILVNNAGLAGQKGLTADGFELTFGTNHLGPYLLTRLLLPNLQAATPARIVNVASRAHYRTGPIDFTKVRKETATPTGFPEYCQSKLANVLFTRELARRLEGQDIDVYAVHPGVVASDIWREVPAPARALMKLFMITNEEGALTSLHCATAPSAKGKTGLYWDKSKPKQPASNAQDDAAAADLWRRSAEWVELPV